MFKNKNKERCPSCWNKLRGQADHLQGRGSCLDDEDQDLGTYEDCG